MRRIMIKKQAVVFLFLLVLGEVTSCSLPVPAVPPQANQEISQQYSTVSALLTETAVGTPATAESPTPMALGTNQVVSTHTPTPALAEATEPQPTRQPPDGQALTMPCELAQAGRPFDITVPDDSLFFSGEYFSKTWRLVNAGNCVWTREYAVVWFSGDDLGLSHAQPFAANVAPGSSVEVTVEMVAPQQPGAYQSNWKLRNGQGELFGIGPNGDGPFWVRIVVVPLDTPTATATFPAATPTPLVFASGNLFLRLDEGADLDSGHLELSENNDLVLEQPQEEGFFIVPDNNAQLVLFGSDAPGLLDCTLAEMSSAPLDLQQITPGVYLCYRTTEGLPGRIYLSAVDVDLSTVDFEFVTWAVP
jgi:hypothetical protein